MRITPLKGLDAKAKNTLLRWALIGLLIRLVLIPFTGSRDLISFWERMGQVVHQGESVFALGGQSIAANTIGATFFKLLSPFLPAETLLSPSFDASVTPNLHRLLFLTKLPNLLLEIGLILLVLALLSKPNEKLSAAKFLIFNPVLIFSLYTWGKFEESLVLLTLFSSLIFARESRIIPAALLLGTAGILRYFPFLFLPFYLIFLGKSLKERAKIALLALLPLAVLTALLWLGKGSGFDAATGAATGPHAGYLFDASSWGLGFGVSPFLVIYTILILASIFGSWKVKDKFALLLSSSFLTLLAYFTTSIFHPHYLAWLTPFLAIWATRDSHFSKLFIIQVAALVGLLFAWDDGLLNHLLAPVEFGYFTSFSLQEIVDELYPLQNLVPIVASIFTATTGFMGYRVIKNAKKA